LTTRILVVIIYNMKATNIINTRAIFAEDAFAEIVVWEVPKSVLGSSHSFKYSLAYVVSGVCVLRLDNEAGKGDHLHYGNTEAAYKFVSTDALLNDFYSYITRWNDENGHT
jgi:hypothetical protein